MRSLALVFLGLTAACTAAPRPASRPIVAPADVVVIDAVPAPTAAARPTLTLAESASFTDEPVVAELARDPRWHAPDDADPDSPVAQLSCAASLHPQSCTPDVCHEGVGDRCRTQCGANCDGCDTGCRAEAERCARPCADDACRVACARANGACLDVCIRAKDQCLSGDCAAQQTACMRSFFDSPCHPVCVRCQEACADVSDRREFGDIGNCFRRCFRRAHVCSSDQQQMCVLQGADYGAP